MVPLDVFYLGGTLGSVGLPLAPLDADAFAPRLLISGYLFEQARWHPCPVKDSSQLDTQDLINLACDLLQADASRCLVITGTDTLSYVASFLSIALSGSHISVAVTGSMYPLFASNASDAPGNLSLALKHLGYYKEDGDWYCYPKVLRGVAVAFAGKLMLGASIQKIDSHSTDAFIGNVFCEQPLYDHEDAILSRLHIDIRTHVCTPMHGALLHALQTPCDALILLGFGTGNVPYTPEIARAITNCPALVVLGSQCPLGGVSQAYEAGNWMDIARTNLPASAIFSVLLWHLCLGRLADALPQSLRQMESLAGLR